MKTVLASLLLVLTGCASYNPPYVAPAPSEPETYLERYEFKQGFNGVEVVVGLPIFEWIPVVGPYLKEMIQVRVGVRQDVLIPVMRESLYEHFARTAAGGFRRSGIQFFPDGVQQRQRPGIHQGGCGNPGVRR